MYEIGTITYSVPPIYKLEKGGQGAHDIFRGGGGALALDDGACGHLLFQKGGIPQLGLLFISQALGILYIRCQKHQITRYIGPMLM